MKHLAIVVLFLFTVALQKAQVCTEKINGVNLVSPVFACDFRNIQTVSQVNANWISVCPWAFQITGDPNVYFNTVDNYWGDRPENLSQIVTTAKEFGMNIILKPHVWINGYGWSGDFNVNETSWYFWELNYSKFILDLAKFAESHGIEMFCIGVEFKTAVQKRPEYWRRLISQVREVYSGKLTYAANWDNYQNITFWDKLDYIGIDAYFPLANDKTPGKEKLRNRWTYEVKNLEKISMKYQKPVLFAEYGYRSIDGTAWKQWEIENISHDMLVNLDAQVNAYEALFEAVWDKKWFAGGFLWKWYIDKTSAGGSLHSGYTPQNKPVEKLIKEWYSK